ncbi:MAG: PilZ domain-containing protein [Candidatus Omnitrophica bacterium]|nr:PilZ domain-containing protein [Candidatus Omnitrophota bacterium]
MQERRVFVRIPVGIDLTYQVNEGLTPPRLGISEDLSLGGMRFRPLERLEAGQRIAVTLDFPKVGKAVLNGLVVWSRDLMGNSPGYQAGLRWDEISPSDQTRLNAFIVEHARPKASPEAAALGKAPATLNWTRVAVLSAVSFLLWLAIARVWTNETRFRMEIDSLRLANRVYEELVSSLAGFPLRPLSDFTQP